MTGKKRHGQQKHKSGTDDPVLRQRQQKNFFISENLAEFFIFHLRQGRVHHDDKPDSDRNVCGADLEKVDHTSDARRGPSEHHTYKHGEKYPQRQIAIQKR